MIRLFHRSAPKRGEIDSVAFTALMGRIAPERRGRILQRALRVGRQAKGVS